MAVDELLAGDVSRVLPGERYPADGELVEGDTHANESMLTGEALPVAKRPGDTVTGGSLNGEGSVHVRVRAVGAQSTLSQIIALVQDAQAGKAPVQRGSIRGVMVCQQVGYLGRVVRLPAGAHAHHQVGVIEQCLPAMPARQREQ
mgnify:CR=1 FL=1